MGAAKSEGICIDGVEAGAEFRHNLSPRFHPDFHGDPAHRKPPIGVIRTSRCVHGDVSEAQGAQLLEKRANCPIAGGRHQHGGGGGAFWEV